MSSVSRSVGRPVSRSVLAGQLNNLTQLIKSLFSLGEQGFAYDPNALTTLYQDAAGTIPVTAAGQPVGLMKDKSGRNNHAFQTVSASRPILQRNATTGAYYLAFDGADDFLQTNSIDFTATDKVSLFAGVRKLGDVATGVICELGIASDQAFSIYAPAAAGAHKFSTRNMASGTGVYTTSSLYSALKSVVLSANIDSASSVKMRLNATSEAVSSEVSGLTMINAPVYISRRAGASLPFNGHIYGLIGIGRLTTDSETAALEKAIAKNTGVTLNV